jgi:hypothetical protein
MTNFSESLNSIKVHLLQTMFIRCFRLRLLLNLSRLWKWPEIMIFQTVISNRGWRSTTSISPESHPDKKQARKRYCTTRDSRTWRNSLRTTEIISVFHWYIFSGNGTSRDQIENNQNESIYDPRKASIEKFNICISTISPKTTKKSNISLTRWESSNDARGHISWLSKDSAPNKPRPYRTTYIESSHFSGRLWRNGTIDFLTKQGVYKMKR